MEKRHLGVVLGLGLALSALAACATGQSDPIETDTAQHWVQVISTDPSGKPRRLVRHIVAAGRSCPSLTLDGNPQALSERQWPSDFTARFPIKLCEAVVPAEGALVVAGKALPPVAPDPQRILVIGDTGCRINDKLTQACNDPEKWPFAALAARAAALDPDLVIHVGDYHYRDRACPADSGVNCEGSPWGNNWKTWQADFFKPVGPLLTAAPWIMVRGNHESCGRAGEAWHYLLSPELDLAVSCPLAEDPYVLTLGPDTTAVVFDTSAWKRRLSDTEEVLLTRFFTRWVDWLEARFPPGQTPENLWALVHHPMWFYPYPDDPGDQYDPPWSQLYGGAMAELRQGLEGFSKGRDPAGLDLLLSGHVHLLQALRPDPGSNLPWQLIAGGGGTLLEQYANFQVLDRQLISPLVVDDRLGEVSGAVSFGFMMLEKEGGSWRSDIYDRSGEIIRRCRLTPNGSCTY